MAQAFLVQMAIAAATTFLSFVLAPTVRKTGARLSDLRIQTSTYGRFITRVYGTTRISGNVIWVENNQIRETEHTEEVGGKGGGGAEVTTYTYSVSMAVALCDNEILAVSRIWADAVLIYDSTSGDPGTLYASDELAGNFTVYTGTMDQEVNPRIEADHSDAPAYRGISYIVFEDLALDDFGRRIPSITCEVVQSNQAYDYPGRLCDFGDTGSPQDGLFEDHYPVYSSQGIIGWQKSKYNQDPQAITVTDLDCNIIATEPRPALDMVPYEGLGMLGTGVLPGRVYINSVNDFKRPAILRWETWDGLFSFDVMDFLGLDIQIMALSFSANDRYLLIIEGATSESPPPSVTAARQPEGWHLIQVHGWREAEIVDSGTFEEGVKSHTWFGTSKGGDADNTGAQDTYSGCLENNLRNFWACRSALGGEVYVYEIGDDKVARLLNTWTGADNVGDLTSGDSPGCWADHAVCQVVNGNWVGTYSRIKKPSTEGEALSAVVTDLCANVGISASDIDVTELTDTVKGYDIGTRASMLANIEQLKLGYRFDIVESEYKIKFIKRGSASVADLTIDDLAAREKGDETPDPLTQERQETMALPKVIGVSYYDSGRDYNISQQYRSRQQ